MICKGCGLDNTSAARFCGHCGKPMSSEVESSPAPPLRAGFPHDDTSRKYPLTMPDGSKPSNPNLWQRDIESPQNAAVTDNGWVAVSGWENKGGKLLDFLWVINPEGEPIYTPSLTLEYFSIRQLGLDPEVNYVWCSNFQKLLVFSVLSPTRLLEVDVPKWPVIGISRTDDQIQAETSEIKYLYSNSGELINKSAIEAVWERFLVGKGNPADILSIANQHLQVTSAEKMPGDERNSVIKMLEHLVDGTPKRTRERAQANKMLGEIALACGDKRTTLIHFKAALGDNPKLGLNRIAKRLEKEASNPAPSV